MIYVYVQQCRTKLFLNPFRTALPFRGHCLELDRQMFMYSALLKSVLTRLGPRLPFGTELLGI